jgi:WD40 repeat protein
MRVLKAHDRQVDVVAFAPDSRTLATAGRDPAVRVWDVASGERVGQVLPGRHVRPGRPDLGHGQQRRDGDRVGHGHLEAEARVRVEGRKA